MKQLIIFLLLIIALLIGYGKYSQYQRYNTPEIDYTTDTKLDLEYFDKNLLLNYEEAIADLNTYTRLQWSANGIDVRTPEDDDTETNVAVSAYSKKLAKVHFYEKVLNNSSNLKDKGLTNKEIKFLEENGIDIETMRKKTRFQVIKSLFTTNIKLYNGEKNALIYEVQKELNKNGADITIDGVYRVETLNAIKKFEEEHNLLADGYLDALTLETIFQYEKD
jgi:hypothetical protein